jgi:hypothetical protein
MDKVQKNSFYRETLVYTRCPTSPEPQENSVIWQNMENVKSEKLLQMMCFSLTGWNVSPRTSRYGATLFTLSVVESHGDVATLT